MNEVIELMSRDGRSTAAVSPFGARVLSWICNGKARLFMPGSAVANERNAPHGGIPVLFPQFGLFGDGPKHGVVRHLDWVLDERGDDFVLFRLALEQDEVIPAADVRLRVQLESNAIGIYFSVINSSSEPMQFTCGLHTYLRVDDVANAQLLGLERGVWYDALQGLARQGPSHEVLSGPVNVDRVYANAPNQLTLVDGATRTVIEQQGFSDTVVWNPGPDLARDLTDLTGDEWRNFLCVEAAQIMPPVELPAWDTWYGHQRLQVKDA